MVKFRRAAFLLASLLIIISPAATTPVSAPIPHAPAISSQAPGQPAATTQQKKRRRRRRRKHPKAA
jgi:hypothetical protein